MKVYNHTKIAETYKNSVLAIGNFDGIHLGHKKVFSYCKKIAKKNKIKFGVLTFSPLPVMFFNKKIKNFRINSEYQKLDFLKKNYVDFVVSIKFDKKFSNIYAEDFIKKIIYKKINPNLIVVSNNFKFGKNRKGDTKLLKKFSKKYDYKLLEISPFKNSKKVVSSTIIRKSLEKGEINLANKLLARTWFVVGKVVRGKKIGRKLGFRTCNISMKDYILPRHGIYAVKVSLNNSNEKKLYNGVAYLGSRPTFNGKKVILETNIFNLNKKLYGKKIKVYFLKFLRGDQKFTNSYQLTRQMNKDVILAKKGLQTKLLS